MSEAYKRVRTARNNDRPTGQDYIRNIFRGFIELHGDRRYADDPAVIGGIARLDGSPVTVIAIEKGRTAKERACRNFGAPNPEGYRKALRLMKQAEKFGRPVICFIDTSGAYCGIGAEERGQGQAIAENLMEMSTLCVPVISILIGEGGSGGALALAVADRVWMLQNAVYSVISPGRLREHSVEGRGQSRNRGGKPEADRGGREKPRRDRTDPFRKGNREKTVL